jgi:hypothetical protein
VLFDVEKTIYVLFLFLFLFISIFSCRRPQLKLLSHFWGFPPTKTNLIFVVSVEDHLSIIFIAVKTFESFF